MSPVAPGQLTGLLHMLARAPAEAELGWAAEPLPGDQVDRFVVVRRVGQGGFGLVFEARDERLKRTVALKLVRAARRGGPDSERLYLEAEAAARLTHPNIVTLFDVGQCPRGPFLVQELLRGESLSERLKRGPLPLAEAVRVGVEVARALAHAHRHAVIHRDLKPGNVFLCEDGQVKVLDFGMAHAFGQPRLDGGTPAFMAPEQRSGAPEDERTDVYALGVTLFQLLTGHFPFGGDGLQHPRLAASGLVIPEAPELAALVERMLEQDPVRRPRDGAAALEALQGIAGALQPAGAGPVRPVRRRRRWGQALLIAAVAVVVSVATIGAEALRRRYFGKEQVPARLLLAVADVVNETGEKELELSGLLRTVLEQSTFLEVLPRSRLIDALTGPQTDGPVALDDASAQAAARSVSARYLLLARLLKLGETYLLEIRAVDPSSGVSRFSFKEQVLGRNGIADLLDRGSEKARLLLGEDPASLRRNSIPTGLVTSSPEAWARYSSGVDCIELHAFAGTFGACLTVMKEAVAIDPGFSLAHLRIAVLQFIEAEPLAFQRESVRLAQLHPERVPPHERQRLEGWAAFLAGRDAEAKSLLLAAARASPGDKLAWYLAGEVPYHRDEYAEAVASFREVYALDPNWLDAGQHLVFGIGVSGDIDGLRSMIAGLARQGDKPWAITLACYARLWTDPASAGDTCLKARELGGEESDRFLAIALLNTGQDERLASHLTAMQREEALRSRGTPARGFPWYMQFILLGVEGRWQELERRARVEGDPTSAWFHVTYAELLAGAGDAASVRREALHVIELNPALASSLAVYLAYLGDLPGAADLERFLPAGSPRMKTYQALVRWRQGDLPGAIEDLRRVAAVAPVSVEPPSLPALYLLGEALAEAGRDREAVESLQRFRRIPLLTPTWTWPRSQWLLARSLHRLGNHDGARSILLPLLRAWDHASETQPHLAEARNLGRSLGIR